MLRKDERYILIWVSRTRGLFQDSQNGVSECSEDCYKGCLPPESSLDDLFYVMSYDAYKVFDPQLIIDELIDMRSYKIRKPMFRFLSRFKDDRAVDYLLEVRDAMISAEQRNARHSRYLGNYTEWKEREKSKAVVTNRKNQEFQTRPYLYFDNGNAV